MTEREAYIALNGVAGVGAVFVRHGIETLGSAVAILSAGAGALETIPGVGKPRAAMLAEKLRLADYAQQLTLADKHQARIITMRDADYPASLKSLNDPPLVLYVRGDIAAAASPCLAMVGTRSPSSYGRETARRFAFQFAQMGVTIVSGLARGIDTESHAATIKGQGKTIAVIGSALDCLYPAENKTLAESIVASGGALISEYPWGRQADRQTFPMRNRIVSGLSLGVLVVEAGLSSGTLITASHALDQGRSVMAIPGRIDSPASQGCHKLIKDGACLVDSIDDVLEEIKSSGVQEFRSPEGKRTAFGDKDSLSTGQKTRATLPPLDETERILLNILGKDEMALEDLMASSNLPAGIVTARLMNLEMKRLVRRLPGHLIKAL